MSFMIEIFDFKNIHFDSVVDRISGQEIFYCQILTILFHLSELCFDRMLTGI